MSAAAVAPVSAGPRPNAKWTFITAIFAVFVTNLDLFVVNVALPNISSDFHGASLSTLSWVLNAYTIVYAALLVVAGRLADRTGHRPAFLLGLAVFTLGSALCALSPDVAFLISARVLQAVGAAILLPTSLALVLTTATPERRPRVVRAWTAVGGVAAALGPALSGVLVQASWRWVFVLNVPVGIAAILVGRRCLPNVRAEQPGPLPDLAGAALMTLGVAGFCLALVRSGAWGTGSPLTIGTFAGSFVLLAAFAAQSARHPAPVVEWPMLRVPTFRAATLAASLFTAAFSASILSLVLWCQQVWGYSALRTGLLLAPGPLLMPPFAIAAGPLAKRLGAGTVAVIGNLLLAASFVWWVAAAGVTPHYTTEVLPGLLLTGIGIGLALPTLIAAAATALPQHRFATGSGVLNMARQLGAVLGIAALVRILGTPQTSSAALVAFRNGWVALAVVSGAAAAASALLRRPGATAAEPAAVALVDEVAKQGG